MLTILLHPTSPEPLYRQLCTGIVAEIAAGTLTPHEKLPSRRALAAHLQVSMITVQTAYEQLAAEGYLYAKPRIGYFVDPDAVLLACVPSAAFQPESSPSAQPCQPADHIHFSTSGVDSGQFPFATWAKLSRQVLRTEQQTLLYATPSLGLYPLRQAIAAHLRAFRNIHAAPEQILVGAGTEYLLGLLVQLIGASRRFAVEDPGFHKGKQILRSNGASVIAIPMDEDGLDPTYLQHSGASVAYVTPSHQFPTGIVMPIRRRLRLIQWAENQPDRYLIEDDYDSELRFQGNPLPSLYSLDRGDHVIYMNTFARTLTPSLRIGYMILPPKLAMRFEQDFSFYSCTVSGLEQATLLRFLEGGYLERHLNRIKKTYRQRRALLLSQLHMHPVGRYLEVCGAQAGLHLLLRVHLNCTESQLVEAAHVAHVTVCGLSDYHESPPPAGQDFPGIVLGFACLSPEEIQSGIKRLLDAWSQFLP